MQSFILKCNPLITVPRGWRPRSGIQSRPSQERQSDRTRRGFSKVYITFSQVGQIRPIPQELLAYVVCLLHSLMRKRSTPFQEDYEQKRNDQEQNMLESGPLFLYSIILWCSDLGRDFRVIIT